MGRIIGLIGGTCLLIALVRLTNLHHDDHTLKADVGVAAAHPNLTPRDAYRRGKEMYLRGHYEAALSFLENATASTSGLSVADRGQAEQYLARTRLKIAKLATGDLTARGQSPDADPFALDTDPPAADPATDAMRTRVERLMSQAVAAAKAGQVEEAVKLAQQANQIAKSAKLTFAKNEWTPAALLQQLQGGKPASAPAAPKGAAKGSMPEWADEPTAVRTAAAVDPQTEIEFVSGNDAPAPQGSLNPAARKSQALALIAAARADMKAGRLPEARRKAKQAEELDVAYDLFDDRPELLLAEIDRRAGTMTLNAAAPAAKSPMVAATAPAMPADPSMTMKPTSPMAPNSAKMEAERLLKLAREDLKNGNLQAAQQKAEQVQQMDVAYKLFEDRPELVLNDVAANMAAANIAAADVPPAAAKSSEIPAIEPNKGQAKDLLARARNALAEGRVDEARQLAIEAERLKSPYGLFDDRPEIVLADIARVTARGPEAKLMPIEQPAAPATPAAPAVASNGNPKVQAAKLMQEARQLMTAGQLEAAQAKAAAAEELNVAYDVFDDRPELILAEIQQAMAGNVAKTIPTNAARGPAVQTVAGDFADSAAPAMTFSGNTTRAAAELADNDLTDAPAIVSPTGASAVELYNRGMAELSRGNRKGAYEAFQAAHQSGERLDLSRAQRLQDYLRELSPRNGSKIQLTNSQVGDADLQTPAEAAPYEEPSPLDAMAQQQSVKFDRLRTETLNAIFRAERLRESNPEQALQIVDQAIAAVEGAELGDDAAAALMRSLQKTHSSLQNEIMKQKPNLDQKQHNDEVLAVLERDRNNKIRVEQEFASLVDEYNTLYQQKRFAEAEVLAKKAKELDPKNPATETMFWKARFARRNENNENLKLAAEESFIKTLDEVEWAKVANVGDDPIDFGTDWGDITRRRKGKYGADNRKRSEDELKIQESLNRRISLHEDNVPLSEVMAKIGTLAGFNVNFDKLGMEEEGVTPSVPVTIDVDGITVRSALNLMLDQYRLGYMVQNEVLNITSRLRQQGELVVATYPVADLVIPIPSFAPTMGNAMGVTGAGSTSPGSLGGAQYSMPPMGAGQPFAQIGQNPLESMTGLTGNDRLAGGSPTADFDTLVSLISTTVAPDSWAEVGGAASIRQYETTLSLVVRQTQKVHEEIADLLDQLRRLQDLQVTIEVRFVTVSDRFFERIGIDFDFNIQPSVGGPDVDNTGLPLLPFGSVLIPQAGANAVQQAQQGAQGQQAQQAQAGTGQFFTVPGPRRELNNRSNYPKNTIVGLNNPGQFSQTLDVPFQQGSFEVGVPTFGGFNPNAGVQVGMAILSDVEAFFFIQAAQGDSRSNLLFAPKVTLFNGQQASVISQVSRPFVISLIPTVGFFSTGFQPVIQFFPDGVSLTVQAVISADRRFVRLTVIPLFTNITDVFTFSFVGGTTGGQQQQGGQGQAGGGFGGGQAGAGGGLGGAGGQFGIGGGMGTTQMVMTSMFAQQNQQGGQQQGQQQQGGAGLTVTVQQPVTEIVSVTTTVSVPDGGTVLLGGVKRLREGRNMSGVPILNKIPYVSRLFKNTGVGRETESVMLMVTPRIIIQEEEEELLGIPTE